MCDNRRRKLTMLKHFPLSRRILLAFSMVFLMLISFICFVLNQYLRGSVAQQNQAHLEAYAASIAQQTEILLREINRISVQVYYSKAITDAFSKSLSFNSTGNYFSGNIAANSTIESALYMIVGTDITDIIVNLYNSRGFYSSKYYPVSWNKVCASMEDGNLAWIRDKLEQDVNPVITHLDGTYWVPDGYPNQSYISLSRPFLNYTTRKNCGTVEVLLPDKLLLRLLNTAASDQMTLLVDGYGDLLCASQAPDDGYSYAIDAILSKLQADSESLPAFGELHEYFYAIQSIPVLDLSIITFQRRDNAIYMRYAAVMLLAAVALYALSLGLCVLISSRLAKPLNKIVSSLRDVSWDKLEMNLNLDASYGDFDVLEEAYSAMMKKLHESINLLIDSRLNEQRASYLALQSQISPHFLYNTIANISACAYENGVYKIVDICDKLCGLMRYAMDYTDELSTINTELEYTRNYLELMKARYEDCFLYKLSYSDACSDVHIPRLITQTVIENCFKHAFRHTATPWIIFVTAYTEDDWWLIDIHYNGHGLPQEQLHSILQESEQIYHDIAHGLTHLNQGGLGLLNSITRLRLFCCNEIKFDIFTNDEGLNVTRFGGKIK